MNTYVKKEELSQINNLTFHLKELEQTKPKANRRKEKTKIRTKRNEIENTKQWRKNNETKRWFFKKINETDKSLSELRKRKRRLKLVKIRNETTNLTEIKMDYREILWIIICYQIR